ncbi:uncharacterized protein DFL_003563 [Arthrobotrys flagrans]|uniref:Uncharacterized protein n=1 Tax=Arthrobotrys flagrans TaxID=97331 RepID=A0A437A297_ARTFL|nr:hypothetical protein DFL_003563 [Arthrobotrys flagrans]
MSVSQNYSFISFLSRKADNSLNKYLIMATKRLYIKLVQFKGDRNQRPDIDSKFEHIAGRGASAVLFQQEKLCA